MNYKTIPEMFFSVIEEQKNKNILNYKNNDDWIPITGSEVKDIVVNLSGSLLYLDLLPKDKVSILSSTSHKWALADYSILSAGMTTTTVYPTLIEEQVEFILNDSESKLIFVENKDQFEKINKIYNKCESLKYIVLLDDDSVGDSIDYCYKFSDLLILGKNHIKKNNISIIEDYSMKISENDLVTLIYTSGTTGMPKGVMLSHKNLISNLTEVVKLQDNLYKEKFLSFLPLSHVLERMAGHFFPMFIKSKIYYAENIETVGVNMSEVSPSIVVCVPRFFEKMYDKIMAGLKDAPAIRQKLFSWGLKIGKDYTNLTHANQSIPFLLKLKHKIADKLIYSKVRAKLGGKIKFFISGGAPLPQKIAEFFSGIGITILEGYGLTETSPVLTSNTPEKIRFGTVGVKLDNVELKIAEDGEILAKGPNVMLGYYNNKEATDEVFDNDGWFHTGDIGKIDDDGFLKITDRKKSLLVTSAGKNIAPAPLEVALNQSKYIQQTLIIGDKRNFISALIVPNYDNINDFLSSISKEKLSNEAMVDHPDVLKLLDVEIKSIMDKFSSYESVKKYKLLPNEFSIEKGEMTPKMSIVRKKVIANYENLIETIYK